MPGSDLGDYIRSMAEGHAPANALEIEREAYEPSWYRVLAGMKRAPSDGPDPTPDAVVADRDREGTA
jgi:hypothetical protein